MGDFLSRFIDQPSVAGGVTWVNLSAAASGLSTADNDPNSVASSFASDATGTTIAVQNVTSYSYWTQGALWLLDDIVALFPDFTEDGTKILLIHGTVVTEVAATTVQYWQGIVAVEGSTVTAGAGVAYKDFSGTPYTQGLTPTGTGTSNGVTLSEGITAMIAFAPDGDARCTLWHSTGLTSASDTTLTTGYRLAFAAACSSNANNGPHSAKVLWKAALVDVVPS